MHDSRIGAPKNGAVRAFKPLKPLLAPLFKLRKPLFKPLKPVRKPVATAHTPLINRINHCVHQF